MYKFRNFPEREDRLSSADSLRSANYWNFRVVNFLAQVEILMRIVDKRDEVLRSSCGTFV